MAHGHNSDRGTRREHLARRQRKKPTPLWLLKGGKWGALGILALLVITLPVYLVSSGWIGQSADRMGRSLAAYGGQSGLQAEHIFIQGRIQTPPAELTTALAVAKNQPLLSFDPHAAKAQLEQLTWVESAQVQRRFPNTIIVSISERHPIGFYQQQGKLALVDATGAVLATHALERWAGLPVLVGEGAPQAAPALLKELQDWPELRGRIKALTWVNGRRWTLRLEDKVDVLLPEGDIAMALQRLMTAQESNRLLEKDIESIDLRQRDRMIVTPTAAANARRTAPKEGI